MVYSCLNGKDTLFHGSNIDFEQIDISQKCTSIFKDFGAGFYTTSQYYQAKSHAIRRASAKGQNEAYIYCYKISDFDRKKYKIRELTLYDLEWLDFITHNRIYGEEARNYDIVYDKMADNGGDNLETILRAYDDGKMDYSTAIEKIKFTRGNKDQYCFKTDRAVSLLVKVSRRVLKKEEGGWNEYEEELSTDDEVCKSIK